jgi:hypothetical protein
LAKALLELFKGAEGRAQKIRQLLETPEKDFGVGN